MTIYYLTVEQVIKLHDYIIEEVGGLKGIRDSNLLESALDAPKVCLYGIEMYKSLPEKGAIYVFHLVKNHAFNDGNKRTAYASLALFYEINHLKIMDADRDKIEDVCVRLAEGNISKEELLDFFTKEIGRSNELAASPSLQR